MRGLGIHSKHGRILAGVIAVLVIGWCFAYEPVTRNYIAQDSVCTYCHLKREYLYSVRMSFSRQHPVKPKEGDRIARCVDCHLPKGFWATTFAYTHFASITDLYGHFRNRPAERAGDWIPLSAARAYRVRNRLMEYDSAPCLNCHVMSEIKPKQPRGQKAHDDAVRDKDTCIKCHVNLVHRYVEVRVAAAATTGKAEEGVDEGLDEGLDNGAEEKGKGVEEKEPGKKAPAKGSEDLEVL
jgi:nitrate/TMAO reductase-like tetraheme cytochrome c subunit